MYSVYEKSERSYINLLTNQKVLVGTLAVRLVDSKNLVHLTFAVRSRTDFDYNT